MRIGNWKLGVIAVVAAMALAASSASAADAPAGPRGAGGPPWARGGQGQGPRPFMLFLIFDTDEDGALTEDEVPAPVWSRLSAADLDDDGAVTRDEIMDHLQKRGGAGHSGNGSRPQTEPPKK